MLQKEFQRRVEWKRCGETKLCGRSWGDPISTVRCRYTLVNGLSCRDDPPWEYDPVGQNPRGRQKVPVLLCQRHALLSANESGVPCCDPGWLHFSRGHVALWRPPLGSSSSNVVWILPRLRKRRNRRNVSPSKCCNNLGAQLHETSKSTRNMSICSEIRGFHTYFYTPRPGFLWGEVAPAHQECGTRHYAGQMLKKKNKNNENKKMSRFMEVGHGSYLYCSGF